MTAGEQSAIERLIGRYTSGRSGPTVVAIAGIHGNEPAGVLGLQAVFERLHAQALPLRGELLGVRGNLGALRAGRRYLARDLNRGWLPAEVRRVLRAEGPQTPEDLEQRELIGLLLPLMQAARRPLVFLDLHSTSGPGAPFTCMADVLRNRPLAFALPVPLILGIEELLDGSLLGWLCDLGHVAVALEGGQNDDARTAQHHQAAVWLALVAAGALAPREVADLDEQRALLATAARGLPAVVEVHTRHVVREGDGFQMLPGFANFSPLQAGQVLAHDVGGPIRTSQAAVLLMPRYQSQGDDGFFLARPVSRAWLRLSAVLRRARLDRLVPLLPGVRRDVREADRFVVDPRVARYQVRNVFHLFGYRHVRPAGGELLFSRRRPGFRGLSRLPEELRALGAP